MGNYLSRAKKREVRERDLQHQFLKILGVTHYVTVTDLARFLGMSGSNPLSIAM